MKGLQRFIIGIYRFLGLLSIPALTIVTTISMANLFTAGKAAQWDNISVVWAWIYAAAIETNVVRLFTEKRKASFALGLGLGIVTCIALQFEGMQQTGSMMWNNPTVQLLLPWIIALRSILVYVLIAYEGRRLMQDDKQVQSAEPSRLMVLKNALLDRAMDKIIANEVPVQSTQLPTQVEQSLEETIIPFGYIYALINPVDDNPFYVGQTISLLPVRLSEHTRNTTNSENKQVIDGIKQIGLRPLIRPLETIVDENADMDAREKYWIEQLRSQGYHLTNKNDPASPKQRRNSDGSSKVRTMQQMRAQKISEMNLSGLSAYERVTKVLTLYPNVSDRELGDLSETAPATAKKYRQLTAQSERVATGGQ